MERYLADSAFALLRRPEYRKLTPGDIKKTWAMPLRTKEVFPKLYGLRATSIQPFHMFSVARIRTNVANRKSLKEIGFH